MLVAIAGATGRIGALTAAALERDAHDVARISRSLGVDLLTGDVLPPGERARLAPTTFDDWLSARAVA